MDSLLWAIDMQTWMAGLGVGEMFLNFPLEEAVQKFARVDLTHYFPELRTGEGPFWLR